MPRSISEMSAIESGIAGLGSFDERMRFKDARKLAGSRPRRLYFSRDAQASDIVVGSGTVGPDANAVSCPSGTSVTPKSDFHRARAQPAPGARLLWPKDACGSR